MAKSKAYVCTRHVRVYDTSYSPGDEVAEDEFLSGYLESCLRMGHFIPKSEYDREQEERRQAREERREQSEETGGETNNDGSEETDGEKQSNQVTNYKIGELQK